MVLDVPTELTDATEAYGIVFLESTERIDATHHTTDYTEMIAFGDASNHFCWILASRSVGHSGFEKLNP